MEDNITCTKTRNFHLRDLSLVHETVLGDGSTDRDLDDRTNEDPKQKGVDFDIRTTKDLTFVDTGYDRGQDSRPTKDPR